MLLRPADPALPPFLAKLESMHEEQGVGGIDGSGKFVGVRWYYRYCQPACPRALRYGNLISSAACRATCRHASRQRLGSMPPPLPAPLLVCNALPAIVTPRPAAATRRPTELNVSHEVGVEENEVFYSNDFATHPLDAGELQGGQALVSRRHQSVARGGSNSGMPCCLPYGPLQFTIANAPAVCGKCEVLTPAQADRRPGNSAAHPAAGTGGGEGAVFVCGRKYIQGKRWAVCLQCGMLAPTPIHRSNRRQPCSTHPALVDMCSMCSSVCSIHLASTSTVPHSTAQHSTAQHSSACCCHFPLPCRRGAHRAT